jgi:hypothetical protein
VGSWSSVCGLSVPYQNTIPKFCVVTDEAYAASVKVPCPPSDSARSVFYYIFDGNY